MSELDDATPTIADEPWAVLEVAFTATPADASDKAEAIGKVLDEALPDAEWHRPAHRSRIAWDNGTLDYTFEVSVHGFKQDLAVQALMHHGLIDNPAALVVA